MKKRCMDATADRISELPEPILQKILCLLPYAKDVARLSILSKALNNAWSSLSYLNFGDNFFYHIEDDFLTLSENVPELVNIVDQILAKRQKQKISIQKFWLTLPSSSWSSYVHNWIKTLVALNIKEIIFSVGVSKYGFYSWPEDTNKLNTLPEDIFAAKELDVLELSGFKLELPPDGIKFSSLRKLSLSNTVLNEHFIRAICERCSGLEDLDLDNIHGLNRLQIAGPKLKVMSIYCPDEFQKVDILAPNLEDLSISGRINILNTEVIKVTDFKTLKRLCLNRVDVTNEWLEDLFSSLHNLEKLWLVMCHALTTIKISSDRLRCLALCLCNNLIVAELNTPNLKSFKYFCSDHEFPALKLKASVCLKVQLNLWRIKPDRQWYSKLIKFLGNFNQSKAIKFVGTNMYLVEDVLDSILSISPPLDTLTFVQKGRRSTLKFIHEDTSDEDDKTCCASLPIKRWRHKLKKVNMENFTSMEKQELRNYFFTNAGTVDLVDVSQ